MTIHHATPIVTRRIEFAHDDSTLVGTLFAPRNAAGALPGILVTGSWTTVKEQMAGLYARRMAAQGFAALAFDFAGFGESGGQPRDVESPARKVRDIHAAVGALAEQPDVDEDRMGALAVCASSGYTAISTAGDHRIRSLALVAPWLHDAKLVREVYGGGDGVGKRIEAGGRARAHYEHTGEVEYVAAVSTSDQSAAMFGDFTYYLDSSRGAVPEWPNRFAVMSWPEWLHFDPIPTARAGAPRRQVADRLRGHDRRLGMGQPGCSERGRRRCMSAEARHDRSASPSRSDSRTQTSRSCEMPPFAPRTPAPTSLIPETAPAAPRHE